MDLVRLAVLSAWAVALSAAAEPGTPEIVSSRQLNGPPAQAVEAPAQRVHLDGSCEGRITAKPAEFLQPDGFQTIHLPLRNVTEGPLKVRISTAFFKSDGAVVENPYTPAKGGFEGMTRGFLGVLSLGASEMAIENEPCEATIVTAHVLNPNQEVIVEHQLPYASTQVVGSRTCVLVVSDAAQSDHAKEMRRMMKEQYWKVRDTYFQERLNETRRWDELRNRLDHERAALEPLSEAYHKAMDNYWKAHQTHQAALAALEAKFASFTKSQEASLKATLQGDSR
jgi:hypothetical protein